MGAADLPIGPSVYTARRFLCDFKPIEELIAGIPAGRGAVVAITAQTGHGKTTVAALMQTALVTHGRFAGRDTTAGAVAVLAGENPDDFAMHLMATLQEQRVDVNELRRLLIVPGTFDITYHFEHLRSLLAMGGDELVAVFVDTSAAFFMGSEENGNVDMLRHARSLRELTTLPGNPTVFVLCHPTKNAQRDGLLPRGGGAFLAEIDANLTLWKDEAGIESMHWCGKIRGAPFDAIRFELIPVELAGKRDSRDRPIFSVAARHIPDKRAEQMQAKEMDDEDVLLGVMLRKPNASVRDLAMQCGWTSGAGKPLSTRVDRRLRLLHGKGLAEQDRKGRWHLNSKGSKEAEMLR
jgi:hypothetical protein